MVPQGQAVVEEEGEAATVLLSELLMGTSTNLSDSEAQVEEINREEVVELFGLMSPMSFKLMERFLQMDVKATTQVAEEEVEEVSGCIVTG